MLGVAKAIRALLWFAEAGNEDQTQRYIAEIYFVDYRIVIQKNAFVTVKKYVCFQTGFNH